MVFALCALVIFPGDSGEALADEERKSGILVSTSSMTGNEAQRFCSRYNRSLAEASRIAELFNSTNELAKSVYWTGNNYRGRTDALWALDFSELTKPVQAAKILLNNRVATAYPVTDFRALAVCVEPPQTGR